MSGIPLVLGPAGVLVCPGVECKLEGGGRGRGVSWAELVLMRFGVLVTLGEGCCFINSARNANCWALTAVKFLQARFQCSANVHFDRTYTEIMICLSSAVRTILAGGTGKFGAAPLSSGMMFKAVSCGSSGLFEDSSVSKRNILPRDLTLERGYLSAWTYVLAEHTSEMQLAPERNSAGRYSTVVYSAWLRIRQTAPVPSASSRNSPTSDVPRSAARYRLAAAGIRVRPARFPFVRPGLRPGRVPVRL